jgi:hypothetical protein
MYVGPSNSHAHFRTAVETQLISMPMMIRAAVGTV